MKTPVVYILLGGLLGSRVDILGTEQMAVLAGKRIGILLAEQMGLYVHYTMDTLPPICWVC